MSDEVKPTVDSEDLKKKAFKKFPSDFKFDENKKYSGTVEWYNVKDHYGFIAMEDEIMLFVHQSSIKKPNPKKYQKSLDNGEKVEFQIRKAKPKKVKDDSDEKVEFHEAYNVTGLNGSAVKGSKYAVDFRGNFLTKTNAKKNLKQNQWPLPKNFLNLPYLNKPYGHFHESQFRINPYDPIYAALASPFGPMYHYPMNPYGFINQENWPQDQYKKKKANKISKQIPIKSPEKVDESSA